MLTSPPASRPSAAKSLTLAALTVVLLVFTVSCSWSRFAAEKKKYKRLAEDTMPLYNIEVEEDPEIKKAMIREQAGIIVQGMVVKQAGIVVWVGAIVAGGSILMGAFMIYRARPGGIAIAVIGGVGGVAMSSSVMLFERYGAWILAGGYVPLLAYGAMLAWRNGWFKRETSAIIERKLIDDGDFKAAGAIHRARTGNKAVAKALSQTGKYTHG